MYRSFTLPIILKHKLTEQIKSSAINHFDNVNMSFVALLYTDYISLGFFEVTMVKFKIEIRFVKQT